MSTQPTTKRNGILVRRYEVLELDDDAEPSPQDIVDAKEGLMREMVCMELRCPEDIGFGVWQ